MSIRRFSLYCSLAVVLGAGTNAPATACEFVHHDGVWALKLNHTEVTRLAAGSRAACDFLPVQAQPYVSGAADAIELVDRIGGGSGVTLISSWSFNPRDIRPLVLLPSGPYADGAIAEYARRNRAVTESVTRLVSDMSHVAIRYHVLKDRFDPAASDADNLARIITQRTSDRIVANTGAMGRYVGSSKAGEGMRMALAAGMKVSLDRSIARGKTDPTLRLPGRIEANRTVAGEWETFALVSNPDGTISLLAHTGHLCAVEGGGYGVIFNRPSVGAWEKFRLVRHKDGTVSLRTENGHYLCAEDGGGGIVRANRTTVGAWETFRMVYVSGGFALQCPNGRYVSAQLK